MSRILIGIHHRLWCQQNSAHNYGGWSHNYMGSLFVQLLAISMLIIVIVDQIVGTKIFHVRDVVGVFTTFTIKDQIVSLLKRKRKLEKERAIAHYNYMRVMTNIESAEETIKRLQSAIPKWREDAKRHEKRRDRLDKNFENLFGKKFLETDETKELEKDLKEMDRLKKRLMKLNEKVKEKRK